MKKKRKSTVQYVKRILQLVLSNVFGVSISRIPPCGIIIDHELQAVADRLMLTVKPFTMLARPRLSILFEFVHHIKKTTVPGAIVECGVWKGGAAGMMAASCLYFDDIRDIHLFDAFDDICEPDLHIDGERAIREVGGVEFAQGRMQPIKGVYNKMGGHGTVDTCKKLLHGILKYPQEHVFFHEGWFQNTIPDMSPHLKSIAILRIDADWYASTKTCLDSLYDSVSLGGVIIVDDYGGYDGCRKAVDEYLAGKGLSPFRNHVDGECIYWYKTEMPC